MGNEEDGLPVCVLEYWPEFLLPVKPESEVYMHMLESLVLLVSSECPPEGINSYV